MPVKLKDITNLDKYLYITALGLKQPFSAEELLDAVRVLHPGWKIKLIKQRCKKCTQQKMLKRTGHFSNVRFECLLSQEELQNATFVYSKTVDANKLSAFMCGM